MGVELNPGGEREGAPSQPGEPDSWEPQAFPGAPACLSLESLSLGSPQARPTVQPAFLAPRGCGPEAAVTLPHPGYHSDRSDVQRPEATPRKPNSSSLSPRPGLPSSCPGTWGPCSNRAGTGRSLPPGQLSCKQLVVLGPRSAWQSSSRVRSSHHVVQRPLDSQDGGCPSAGATAPNHHAG